MSSHAPLEAVPLARSDVRGPARCLVLAAAAVVGCTFHLGRLDVVSVRPPGAAPSVRPAALGPSVSARSCVWVVGVVPVTSLPNLGDAVARAQAARDAPALYDAEVRYTILYLPPGIGRACYVAEGRTP